MLTQRPRHRGAEHVLQHRNDQREDEEGEHQRAAAAEQCEAGRESNRREERILKRDLQRSVELQRLDAGEVENREDAGNGKAAAHRRGDVDLAEDWNKPANAIAGKEDDTSEGDGLYEIEGYRQHDAQYKGYGSSVGGPLMSTRPLRPLEISTSFDAVTITPSTSGNFSIRAM